MSHLELIQDYFKAWINNDISCFDQMFAKGVYYSECYGPEYHGVSQLKKWFSDWHTHGQVTKWTIKDIVEVQHKAVVEWVFKCVYDNEASHFDGVTIIEFNEQNLIISLKEFSSNAKHYLPYGEID